MLNFFDYHATRVSATSSQTPSSEEAKTGELTSKPWPETSSRKRSRIAFDLEDTLFLEQAPDAKKNQQAVNPRVARMAQVSLIPFFGAHSCTIYLLR